MRTNASLILAALLPLTFGGACAADLGAPGEADDPSNPTPPGQPNPDSPDSSARLDGSYEVKSQLSLDNATTGLAGILGSFDDLASNPAETIVDLLAGEGNDPLDGVPGFLKDIFYSQINNYILSNSDVAVQLQQTTEMIGAMVNSFETVSTLQIGNVDSAGNATATHQLKAINFSYRGQTTVVQAQNSTMSENISINAEYSTSKVDIGSHEITLPLGAFAAEAIDSALIQSGQGSLQTILAQVIDCNGAASAVGDIAFAGVTLLSVATIENLCDQALVIAAAQVKAKLGEVNLEMNVVGGQGSLQASGSSINSFTGTWDFALSGESLPSAFEAQRK
jgi:hypothetical protein